MVGVLLEDERGSGVAGEGLQISDRFTALGVQRMSDPGPPEREDVVVVLIASP